MIAIAPDGYIVYCVGPYFADSKNNDASILSHMLSPDTLPEIFARSGKYFYLHGRVISK